MRNKRINYNNNDITSQYQLGIIFRNHGSRSENGPRSQKPPKTTANVGPWLMIKAQILEGHVRFARK